LIYATLVIALTRLCKPRRVLVPYQSGIESCLGRRFIDLSHPLKRLPMQSYKTVPKRFGVRPPRIRRKATYPALRLIAVSYHRAREALNLRRRLCRSAAPEPHLRHGGISILQAVYCSEPTQRERSMPQSRYPGSLMGSHDSLTGLNS
jgi:hypothetical protein